MQNIAVIAIAVAVMTLRVAEPLSAADGLVVTGGQKTMPLDLVKVSAKGQLRNPQSNSPEIIAEGQDLYQAKTCGACHGASGKGNHGPSLVNDAWIYGSDDDTIFRLVTLGSEGMLSGGFIRGDKEKHAGPMPGFGSAFADDQELWKIISYIRSLQPTASGR